MEKRRTGLLKFIAELLIVFVGVYGAFELNRYQENNRENKIREAYIGSFKSELNKLSYDIEKTQAVINKAINEFESALQKGERPLLKPLDLFFDAPMLITIAGFNDDVFTQLDAGLAASLSGGYDNVQAVSQRVRSFNEICHRQLISNEPIEFYDRNGTLKSQFNWYLSGLKKLQAYMQNLSQMINKGAVPAVNKLITDFEK